MRVEIEILSPGNCIMAAVAVAVGVFIAASNFPYYLAFLASFIAFIVCGAGNIINDYYDYSIDLKNNPKRPLPSGRMTLREAYYYSIFLFALGVFLAFFISPLAFLLAFFNSFLLFFYARNIKKAGGISKNVTVSYLVGSPFLYGGIVGGGIEVTLLLVLLAGLANTSREILKDIEDFEGDRDLANTLPHRIGFEKSALLARIFLVLAVLVSPLPYLLGVFGEKYLLPVVIADTVFIYSFLRYGKVNQENARTAQKKVKIGMFFGLLSFLLGAL